MIFNIYTNMNTMLMVLLSLLYFYDNNALTKAMPIYYLVGFVAFGSHSNNNNSNNNRHSGNAWIRWGLILSSFGDISLFYQEQYPDLFLVGLGLFLLAHIAYIIAYCRRGANYFQSSDPLNILFIGLYLLVLMTMLLPVIHDSMLQRAVFIYGCTIASMGLLALNKYTNDMTMWPQALSTNASYSAMIGSILFLFSDSILALNKFYAPISHAHLWVMITYYAGQFFIARSCT